MTALVIWLALFGSYPSAPKPPLVCPVVREALPPVQHSRLGDFFTRPVAIDYARCVLRGEA